MNDGTRKTALGSSAPGEAGAGMMPITEKEFQLLREMIHRRFGITLSDQKRSLLVGRLQKLLRSSGFGTFGEYYDFLVQDKTEAALSDLVDRISTNHTHFNREKAHFDYFSETALPNVIARLKQENRRDLRIWCAGCSSGEEPYMLLMLMMEYLGSEYSSWNAGILATDISDRVLTAAKAAVYPEERVALVPEHLRRKYFQPQGPGQWVVREQVRKEATFRRLNLMNETFPFKKPFQIIFCRNVMIYFDQPTREALVRKFHHHTEPGGYLFIGHSETLGREQSLYRYLMPATYRKGEA